MKKPILPITLFSIIVLAGCNENSLTHKHEEGKTETVSTSIPAIADEDLNDFGDIIIEEKHDHKESDDHQAHGDSDSTIVITQFGNATELFVEFPAFVMGQDSPMAAHLTFLENYKPISTGKVSVVLTGGGAEDEMFSIENPTTPGIFRPVISPKHLVKRNVRLRLQNDHIDETYELGEFTVYPSQALATADTKSSHEPHDAISYLKEQQWQVDFAITRSKIAQVKASIKATGTLRPRADGEVYLSATSAGHLQSSGRFPYPGMHVERGQLLAKITPRLGAGDDLATLKAAMEKAKSKFQLAEHEHQRLAKLWKQKAIAEHRLHEAESEESVARAEFDAAKRRYKQSTGGKQSTSSGIPVLAPISGVLAQVNIAPGQYVHEGDALFHIVNVDKLWLETRIAGADLGKLTQPSGAWFNLEGYNNSFNTADINGHMVSMGAVVDPVSRTAPLIFEFKNVEQNLSVGLFANVRVYTGESSQGVVIPASAVFDDGGQNIVYVMLSGESFQRRVVRLGIRDGEMIEILSGVEANEYVVSRGAYMVRLASASPAEAGHGHAH